MNVKCVVFLHVLAGLEDDYEDFEDDYWQPGEIGQDWKKYIIYNQIPIKPRCTI